MQKQIDLVVCDIEGCLTINKRRPIDLGQLGKIQAYCEMARRGQRPPLVLCTGRPQPYAEAVIQALDAFFPGFPSIVENGCFIYEPVEDVLLPTPKIKGKRRDLQKVRQLLEDTIIAHGYAKVEPGKELCISLNPVGGQSVENLFGEVKKLLAGNMDLVNITHSSSAVDITPLGVNKASGLEYLREYTKIPFESMLGIGDTAGDFPFLEQVGIPACPSNASADVVKLVTKRNGYVAKSPNTAGVWEILLNFQLAE